MSGSTQVIKDFTTPDRPLPSSDHGDGNKNGSSIDRIENGNMEKAKPVLVTPPEPTSRDAAIKQESTESPLQSLATDIDSPEDRHVRFNKEMEKKDAKGDTVLDSPSSSSTGSQRGLVSRRGGRCSSPGRNLTKPPSTKDVLEVKTYRSPPRKKDDGDNVPSLCSASSEKAAVGDEARDPKPSATPRREDGGTSSTNGQTGNRPASISCDAAIDQTSPLTSTEGDKPADAKSPKPKAEDGRKGATGSSRRNNVTFSPVPPPKQFAERTPMKSPSGGRFHSLPSLDDAALASPGGLFLSPHPATPSYRGLPGSGSFDNGDDRDGRKPRAKDPDENDSKEHNMLTPTKTPRSPRTPRREDRDRFLATPTDFAMDYGKPPNSGPFDSSNVLAWLQSPTANGLFSPGGLGSIMNTPRGGPRTPRTPTVSTSFFFSDVAGLPRSGDVSPKPGGEGGKRGGSQRGYSNIICISPLASSKAKNGGSKEANTPTINYKDMFASPAERNRGLSLMDKLPKGLSSRTARGSATKDPSIDAVHMAERDLMEDEDLSVLLQLASNTPRSTGEHPVAVSTSDGTHVFRSPNERAGGAGGDESLPSLQLPVIGGRDSESNGTRLTRKTHSRDHGESADELHRPLGVRSNGLVSSKDVYRSKSSEEKNGGDKRKDKTKADGPKKSSKMHPAPPQYMAPHHYPHPDAPYYPPMPPGMAPHGSMRVIVGGPPPSRSSGSSGSPHASPHAPRPYPMGPGDPNYPPPPYPPPPGHYPHHPGVPPPPHMHPHYSHYPPPHHAPRPPHMPMYGAQHPPGKSKTSKKTTKPGKLSNKRPANTPVPKGSATKKQKKPSPASAPKKKAKSPQITDKADRQKAAAAIQAVNAASGGKNDKAAALAAAILRGVTMRPSGKWQAQLYFAGKSRYIGVFDTREKAALAYEIAREKLKSEKSAAEGGTLTAKQTEAAVNAARKAAFEGVNESDPRLSSK
eukprot:CAMPEP_0116999132 /NCGR_PEP_ID=MMETSP0472-20121206/1955_1 /TAXON_ID=693140 ORGANISM="Tiarina fusus, Strain LIS" /NCGR_SAMPLE_ID=MMETSP0472 /ASSEMBLY_ACC=CAM_ASM_000603 /LENGTH=969 /DNA_ID=CAMNT_0004698481 /DNA_START=187 /DNA_END=3096 /DNA_ORIENTATION=+